MRAAPRLRGLDRDWPHLRGSDPDLTPRVFFLGHLVSAWLRTVRKGAQRPLPALRALLQRPNEKNEGRDNFCFSYQEKEKQKSTEEK